MGYFIQISNDSGRPIFQAAKNYPDVSFASSALFHALVTASLEQGFVPSILRADDAIIALDVHGESGARLGLAMVASELSAGRTSDLETRAKWRLDALYKGARLILGKELLSMAAAGQQADLVRRVLSERLSTVVLQFMAEEEDVSEDNGWNFFSNQVPQTPWPASLGLRLAGASVEWMALGCSSLAEHALEELLSHLQPEALKIEGKEDFPAQGATDSPVQVIKQRPPAVICWRGRVIAATPAWRRFNSIDRGLLVAMADSVGPQAFGEVRSLALEEVENLWISTDGTELQHQMLNIRLYPDQKYIPPELHDSISDARKKEDASLVLSVLAPLQACKDENITLPALRESASHCSTKGSLPFLWEKLLGKAEGLLRLGSLSAAILLDERSGDVVAFPAFTSRSKNVPDTSACLRRAVYWFHALPALSSSCSQRFVCCEGYVIAAARREDGILCWACSLSTGSMANSDLGDSEANASSASNAALKDVLMLLKHLPRAPNLWSALGALEAPGVFG
eukprot:Skav205578  [mRNA]  locus=scaffold460:42712:44250:+ [translate_table: standard]